MAFVERTLRQRPLESDDPEGLLDFINRELVPTILELRREVNRLGGNVRSITDDSVADELDVKRTDSILNCANAIAIELALAPAADVDGKVVTIKSSGAASVTVFAQTGELIDSASSVVIATTKSLTLYSDGTQFWIIGEVD